MQGCSPAGSSVAEAAPATRPQKNPDAWRATASLEQPRKRSSRLRRRMNWSIEKWMIHSISKISDKFEISQMLARCLQIATCYSIVQIRLRKGKTSWIQKHEAEKTYVSIIEASSSTRIKPGGSDIRIHAKQERYILCCIMKANSNRSLTDSRHIF